jgi:hypothetical protein
LAGCASLDVLCDKGFDIRPPIIRGNELEGLGNAGVFRCFMVMKKYNYPSSKSIICYNNKGSAVVLMGAINSGEIVYTGTTFKHRLFRILSAFDVLLKGVLKTVPVYNINVGVCFTKIFVQPDSDVFVVWISVNFVIRAVRKGICIICSPRFVF